MKNQILIVIVLLILNSVNAQWTKLPAFPGDKETIIGGDGTRIYSYDNWTTHISTDNGQTKKNFLLSQSYAMEFNGNNVILGGWQMCLITSDAGLNFTDIKAGLSNTKVLTLKMKGNTLFAGTDGGGVNSSADNGATWTNVSNGFRGQQASSQQSIYKLVIDGSTLYAGTNYGLYKSTNDGANWSLASNTGWPDGLPMTPSSVKAFTVNGNVIVAAPNSFPLNSSVYVSTDGGANWTKKIAGLPNMIFYPSALLFVGNNIIMGTDIGVYKSTDNGNNWTSLNVGLTNGNINSIYSDGTTLFIGTGNGLYSLPVTEVVTDFATNTVRENELLVYPNPAKNAITVQLNKPKNGYLLNIYNLQGQLLLSHEISSGKNNVDINTFSVGTYFVKFLSNGNVTTRKFVKE